MKVCIEVETERHTDAREIAKGLRRLVELELAGTPVRVHVTAGRRGRIKLGRLVRPADVRPRN